DDAQHEHGPGSPEALAAVEEADSHVQQIVDVVASTGLQNETDIVIVSDHGFLPLEHQLQPNYVFKREGLLDVDDAGKIRRWDAYFYTSGGSGFVVLKNPGDTTLRSRVEGILRALAADPANGILTIWNEDDLKKLGADPRASFGIDMRDGFYSSAGHRALLTKTSTKGGHGFGASRPDLYASLVMRGQDVRRTGSLGVVRMSQIGPTIASWFQVALSPASDTALDLPRAQPSREQK
ncbi:MAG TPA: alkaline phosphatase family protein, partial [Vicinamibacterales bacterium]